MPRMNEDEIELWELRRGNECLATLEVCDMDFPWRYCRVHALPAFEPLRDRFIHPKYGGYKTTRANILAVFEQNKREGITIVLEGRKQVGEFTLYVDGDSGQFQFI